MKLKNILLIALVVIVCLFVFRECSNYSHTNSLLANVVSYKDSVKIYRNINGDLVAYNQSLEFQNKKQMNAYLAEHDMNEKELKKWKSISPAIQIKTVTEIKHDTVFFKDTINAMFEPVSFSNIEKDYSLFATFAPTMFIIDSLRIPNQQSIIVGEKKIGFFRTEKRVEVVNSNPLIQTTNLGSYTLNEKKKWYETRAFALGVGLVAGFTLNKFTIP